MYMPIKYTTILYIYTQQAISMVYSNIICVCVCLRQVPELAFPRLRVKVHGPFGPTRFAVMKNRGFRGLSTT